jgi:hypothetical protein
MTDLIRPRAGILFMKVGTHAQENLDDIFVRKSKEIADCGFTLWGYGGNTCHPETMVQPFAKSFEKRGQTVRLFMEPMNSSHFAEPLVAREYSVDGLKWHPIPPAIQVRGSRFALAIKDLRKTEFALPLQQTFVAVGTSMGRRGDLYVKGRVDKACLEVADRPAAPNEEQPPRTIGLVADIVDPYAVYLKDTR